MTTHDVPSLTIPDPSSALASVLPELTAMPETRVRRHNTLDGSFAAEVVIGNVPELRSLREPLERAFGPLAAEAVEQLLLHAAAVKQAEIDMTLSGPMSDLGALSRGVTTAHAMLFADAQAMAKRGFLDPSRVEACRSVVGYRAQYHNLLSLEQLVRAGLAAAAGQTAVTVADLDGARALGLQMMQALSVREQSGSDLPAAEIRIRAISRLVELYEEVRRNVWWLRYHEGDVDTYAPSLWAAQFGRRSEQGPRNDAPTPSR